MIIIYRMSKFSGEDNVLFHALLRLRKIASKRKRSALCIVFILAHCAGSLQALAVMQETPPSTPAAEQHYLQDLFSDQKVIWTSPARIRSRHLPWLIPFFATTGGLIATDSNVAKQLPGGPSLISNSRTFANAGLALAVG